MARLISITVSIFGGLVACREEVKQQPMARGNLMVLEVGSIDSSLAHNLARLRTPPREAQPSAVPGPDPGGEPAGGAPPPRPDPVQPQPEPAPVPGPEFHVVTLHAGETLYGLCTEHLGSGARWKEVASLNGWSEAKANNLRAGQRVRLPR